MLLDSVQKKPFYPKGKSTLKGRSTARPRAQQLSVPDVVVIIIPAPVSCKGPWVSQVPQMRPLQRIALLKVSRGDPWSARVVGRLHLPEQGWFRPRHILDMHNRNQWAGCTIQSRHWSKGHSHLWEACQVTMGHSIAFRKRKTLHMSTTVYTSPAARTTHKAQD